MIQKNERVTKTMQKGLSQVKKFKKMKKWKCFNKENIVRVLPFSPYRKIKPTNEQTWTFFN